MIDLINIKKIAVQFQDIEHLVDVTFHGNGHINTTYLLKFDFEEKEKNIFFR